MSLALLYGAVLLLLLLKGLVMRAWLLVAPALLLLLRLAQLLHAAAAGAAGAVAVQPLHLLHLLLLEVLLRVRLHQLHRLLLSPHCLLLLYAWQASAWHDLQCRSSRQAQTVHVDTICWLQRYLVKWQRTHTLQHAGL